MNRKQYLESAMTEEKNVATVVASTLKKDAKLLSKTKDSVFTIEISDFDARNLKVGDTIK